MKTVFRHLAWNDNNNDFNDSTKVRVVDASAASAISEHMYLLKYSLDVKYSLI